MKNILFCFLFCVAASLFFGRAGAAVLLVDSFDYANGSLVTVSSGAWTHHSGAVTGEVNVVSGRILLNAADNEDVNAALSGQPYDSSGPTNIFYASFTVRFTSLPGAAGTYFALFKDSSATGFRARVWAFTGGAAPGKFRLGISSTSGSAVSATNPADLSLNTNYTVVTRLVNTNSMAKLWVNPSAESDLAAVTTEGASTFTVAAYAFRQNSGEGILNVDDLRVGTAFTEVMTNAPSLQAPVITAPVQSRTAVEGSTVTLSISADGNPPPVYQWQFNGTNLAGAVEASLTLTNVSFARAGFYSVTARNAIDTTGSGPAILNVFAAAAPAFTLLTYNLHGNGTLNWSTNTAHVRAIGRQMQFLDPDILTFQEIPVTNNGTAQMTNFVAAFRPGFYLATNSTDDGFIHSAILSRYPIIASRSRLHAEDLTPFGYSGSGFTRDLFEAEISVPGFPQPLHVFTVHLKSGQDSDSAAKRAAEAGAISNFFAAGFLTTNALQPCILTGDMNEDLMRPPASDPQSLQRLTASPTGLRLTTPLNPTNLSELTFSIQNPGGLSHRYDYILPCGSLYSNTVGSQVFRTDLLMAPPAPLLTGDDATASDHLPVLMVFGNPYDKPFRVFSMVRTNPLVSLTWESVPGQWYRVDGSSNLTTWAPLAANLLATGSSYTFTTNLGDSRQFFRIYRAP